jgi:hypothetical protein
MSKQLFSPILSSDEKKGFGGFRSFEAPLNLIEITDKTYTRVDNTGVYHGCQVYKTNKPIKLSTRWSGGARPFLYGPKKIDLPIGSFIYLIPEGHQIYRLDSWTQFDVSVGE